MNHKEMSLYFNNNGDGNSGIKNESTFKIDGNCPERVERLFRWETLL